MKFDNRLKTILYTIISSLVYLIFFFLTNFISNLLVGIIFLVLICLTPFAGIYRSIKLKDNHIEYRKGFLKNKILFHSLKKIERNYTERYDVHSNRNQELYCTLLVLESQIIEIIDPLQPERNFDYFLDQIQNKVTLEENSEIDSSKGCLASFVVSHQYKT